ncbi:MAG: RNA polymerase sigma factor [Bacteroidota bacterium]
MRFPQKTYHKKSDEALMLLICQGDGAAFNILYKRYKDRLYYYFYRMLGNSETLAEDFLQDIFYKIIHKPELYEIKRPFSTWIFSIANNMCKNEYRRKAVRESSKHEMVFETEENPVFENGEGPKVTELIFKMLQTLSEEHRSCFLLYYREEFSVEHIATMLEISPGTVKSRLFNARKKMREKLEKAYPEMIKEVRYEF